MNTGKQVYVMIALVFVLLLSLIIYAGWDPIRAEDAEEQQLEKAAERGAHLYAQFCAVCHGEAGQGLVGPILNTPDNRPTDPNDLQKLQAYFTDTIRCGRKGTLMPPWSISQGGALDDEQIRQLVVLITTDAGNAWDKAHEETVRIWEESGVPQPPTGPITRDTCGQLLRSERLAAALPSGIEEEGAAPAQGEATPTATPAATVTPAAGTITVQGGEHGAVNYYDITQLTVKAGQEFIMEFKNIGIAVHNLHIYTKKGGDSIAVTDPLAVQPGGVGKLTAKIDQPGTYYYQCDFHPADMFGTLTVVE